MSGLSWVDTGGVAVSRRVGASWTGVSGRDGAGKATTVTTVRTWIDGLPDVEDDHSRLMFDGLERKLESRI